ncbi:MAG: hypothetical protein RR216_06560, partial [Pseudoflavonifractor sp.]
DGSFFFAAMPWAASPAGGRSAARGVKENPDGLSPHQVPRSARLRRESPCVSVFHTIFPSERWSRCIYFTLNDTKIELFSPPGEKSSYFLAPA